MGAFGVFLGLVCFAIAIGTICWVFIGSHGFARSFKYFLWAAAVLVLVVIVFHLAMHLGLTTRQMFSLGIFVSVFSLSWFIDGKSKTNKPKKTDDTSTNNSPPRSRRDRDTGRYL